MRTKETGVSISFILCIWVVSAGDDERGIPRNSKPVTQAQSKPDEAQATGGKQRQESQKQHEASGGVPWQVKKSKGKATTLSSSEQRSQDEQAERSRSSDHSKGNSNSEETLSQAKERKYQKAKQSLLQKIQRLKSKKQEKQKVRHSREQRRQELESMRQANSKRMLRKLSKEKQRQQQELKRREGEKVFHLEGPPVPVKEKQKTPSPSQLSPSSFSEESEPIKRLERSNSIEDRQTKQNIVDLEDEYIAVSQLQFKLEDQFSMIMTLLVRGHQRKASNLLGLLFKKILIDFKNVQKLFNQLNKKFKERKYIKQFQEHFNRELSKFQRQLTSQMQMVASQIERAKTNQIDLSTSELLKNYFQKFIATIKNSHKQAAVYINELKGIQIDKQEMQIVRIIQQRAVQALWDSSYGIQKVEESSMPESVKVKLIQELLLVKVDLLILNKRVNQISIGNQFPPLIYIDMDPSQLIFRDLPREKQALLLYRKQESEEMQSYLNHQILEISKQIERIKKAIAEISSNQHSLLNSFRYKFLLLQNQVNLLRKCLNNHPYILNTKQLQQKLKSHNFIRTINELHAKMERKFDSQWEKKFIVPKRPNLRPGKASSIQSNIDDTDSILQNSSYYIKTQTQIRSQVKRYIQQVQKKALDSILHDMKKNSSPEQLQFQKLENLRETVNVIWQKGQKISNKLIKIVADLRLTPNQFELLVKELLRGKNEINQQKSKIMCILSKGEPLSPLTLSQMMELTQAKQQQVPTQMMRQTPTKQQLFGIPNKLQQYYQELQSQHKRQEKKQRPSRIISQLKKKLQVINSLQAKLEQQLFPEISTPKTNSKEQLYKLLSIKNEQLNLLSQKVKSITFYIQISPKGVQKQLKSQLTVAEQRYVSIAHNFEIQARKKYFKLIPNSQKMTLDELYSFLPKDKVNLIKSNVEKVKKVEKQATDLRGQIELQIKRAQLSRRVDTEDTKINTFFNEIKSHRETIERIVKEGAILGSLQFIISVKPQIEAVLARLKQVTWQVGRFDAEIATLREQQSFEEGELGGKDHS